MNTYNKYFNEAWEYLDTFHNPLLATNRKMKGSKFEGFAFKYTLDMSFKPIIKKSQWVSYMDALVTIIKIGQRENFLTTHVDSAGRQVYFTVDKKGN